MEREAACSRIVRGSVVCSDSGGGDDGVIDILGPWKLGPLCVVSRTWPCGDPVEEVVAVCLGESGASEVASVASILRSRIDRGSGSHVANS